MRARPHTFDGLPQRKVKNWPFSGYGLTDMKRGISSLSSTAILAVIMCSFFHSAGANAAEACFKDGNWLNEANQADKRTMNGTESVADMYSAGQLFGYTQATAEFLISSQQMCPPQNVTVGQMDQVVSNYLERNPQLWGTCASSLISTALHEAFPCR